MCQLSLFQTGKLLTSLFVFSILYSIYCSFHSQPELDGSAMSGMKNKIVVQKKSDESRNQVDLAEFQAASVLALSKMAEVTRRSNFHEIKNVSLTVTSGIHNSSDIERWASQLRFKLQCLHGSLRSGGIFLYHMRKAAGTTIRDMLVGASRKWCIPFYETEGKSLNKGFLEENLILVTSLRDPIERIFSLYWYEHVGWFDGVLKQTNKCKSLKSWVDGWRDGSQWKNEFIIKNPGSVYVEIENYYVKALSGWIGPAPVGEAEYNTAIEVLDRFDVVFVTEWISQETQRKAMSALFSIPIGSKDKISKPVRRSAEPNRALRLGHEVRGDGSVKMRLGQSLASDKVCSLPNCNFFVYVLEFQTVTFMTYDCAMKDKLLRKLFNSSPSLIHDFN
jgi:hypothetical protein